MSNKDLPELSTHRDPGNPSAAYDGNRIIDPHHAGEFPPEKQKPRQPKPPARGQAIAGTNNDLAYGRGGPSGEGGYDQRYGVPEDGGRGYGHSSPASGSKIFSRGVNMAKEFLRAADNPYDEAPSRQDYRHDSHSKGGSRKGSATPKRPRPELEYELQAASQTIRALKDQVNKLEDRSNQLKRRNDALQSLRDAQEEVLGRQVQDSTISADFHDIFSQIKSWSGKFCRDASQPMDIQRIEPEVAFDIQRVIPSLANLDQLPALLPPGDIKRRRQFIRGWIALNVAEHMFRTLPAPSRPFESGSDIWIPTEPRNAVKSLEMTLLNSGDAISLSAFHEWRALTFALFNRQFPARNWPQETLATFQQMIHRTIRVIEPLASRGVDLADLERRLMENVFIPAVMLSQVLRRQRACWYVRFPHVMVASSVSQNEYTEPYLFRPDEMEDVDCPSEEEDDASGCLKAVEIVISPSLYKSGNQDGEQYDVEYPILKAEVSCIVRQEVLYNQAPMAAAQAPEGLVGAKGALPAERHPLP